jgi:hypothetical protein
MNTVLLYTIAVAAFIVTILGGILLAALLLYGIYRLIASIWEHTSAAAQNTKEYMRNKEDFDLYKRDVDVWDEYKKTHVEKCYGCKYRRKAMEEEDHETDL